MKAPTYVVLSALAATVLAAGAVTVGVHGVGRATAADGRSASFNFEDTKRTEAPHAPTFAGRFRFEQRASAKAPYVLIEAGAPTTLGVTTTGNVCEFAGRGFLTRLVHDKPVKVGGVLSVRAEDDRKNGKGDPDKLRVRFSPEHGDAYAFEGLVGDGDLSVFSR